MTEKLPEDFITKGFPEGFTEVRTCANCACHFVEENQQNKLEHQSFCRRDTPMAAQMRGEKPRMRDGKVVMGRDNKPVMENTLETIYLYKPTMPNLVCFDGWREVGTLPGERASTELSTGLVKSMMKLFKDMVNPSQEEIELQALMRLRDDKTPSN